MPNWKTYESSVRLLSAILAAHPDLKLNYAEISTCFGGDCTTSALENRFRKIKTDARLIKEAISNGIDPITLQIEAGRVGEASTQKGLEMSKYYGDVAPHSITVQFTTYRKEANALRAEYESNGFCNPPEMARIFKGDGQNSDFFVTEKAINLRCHTAKKDARALLDEAGLSEECTGKAITHQISALKKEAQALRDELTANGVVHFKSGDISKYFGDECTPKAANRHLEKARNAAKDLISEFETTGKCVYSSGEIAKYVTDDCTKMAVWHAVDPMKKNAELLRESVANTGGVPPIGEPLTRVAGKLSKGDDIVTAKAVSMHFERLRKTPQWLGNEHMITNDNTAGTDGAATNGSTPAKAKTPRKPKGSAKNDRTSGDDDEEFETPTKKGGLNKVANGRVTKAAAKTPRKNSKTVTSYEEVDDAMEDDNCMVKSEDHGNGFGYEESEHDQFMETQEFEGEEFDDGAVV